MMLSKIKTRTKGVFAYFIVGMITIPFLLTGIDQYQQDKKRVGIEVGDGFIEQAEIDREVEPRMEILKKIPGYEALLNRNTIEKQVIKSLITKKVIQNYSQERNQVATLKEIAELIMTVDTFHVNGEFNLKRYQDVLNSNQLSVAEYEERVRTIVSADKALKFLKVEGYLLFEKSIKGLLNEQKNVGLTVITTTMDGYVEATDEDLGKLYEDAGHELQTQKKMDLDYIELTENFIRSRIDISEERVLSEYDQYVSSLKNSRTVTIWQKVEQTESQAREHLVGEVDNVDMGTLSDNINVMENLIIGDLDPKTMLEVTKLKPGQKVVFNSEFGWHALKLLSEKVEKPLDFDIKKEDLITTLRQEVYEIEKQKVIEELDALVYEGTFSDIIDYIGSEVKSLSASTVKELVWDKKENRTLWSKVERQSARISKGDKNFYYTIKDIEMPRKKTIEEAEKQLVKMHKDLYMMSESINQVEKIILSGEDVEPDEVSAIPANYLVSEADSRNDLSKQIFARGITKGYIVNQGLVVYYQVMEDQTRTKEITLYDIQSVKDMIEAERISAFVGKVESNYKVTYQNLGNK